MMLGVGLLEVVTSLAFSYARIVLGFLFFTLPLPLRERAAVRVPVTLLALFAFYVASTVALLLPASQMPTEWFLLAQLLTYSALLLASVVATLVIYETSAWTALFCCSAGYTVQNLASGTVELVWSLMDGGDPLSGSYNTPTWYLVSVVCTGIIYAATYVLITRYLRRTGLERVEDRSMIAIMAMVILVIIGFDLVIKWLVGQGIAPSAMVLLRIFHGLACVFTLSMEFELLIRRRTEAERDTLSQVLAEHERQYATARENIDAINARVHDIRHSIGRLADNGGVDSGVIRDMVREVAVYDSKVRTGNEALDTALTERRLKLERAGVALTCVADGAALSFMAPADTYTLFCSLLDAVADAGATTISLVVREALGTVSVHLESNGGAPSDEALSGAGVIARRHGGTLSTLSSAASSHVNLLFPAQ